MRALTSVALCLVCFALPAHAQVSGGSFGGGSFSSGGGSSYSGSSYSGSGFSGSGFSGSSYSGSGFSGDGYSSYSGGGGSPLWGLFTFLIFVIVAAIAYSPRRATERMLNAARPRGSIDVVMIQLALDARARRFAQARLAELARGDTASQGGLANLARETAMMLRHAETAWIYAGVREWNPQSPQQAEAQFRQAANDARSRYRHELIRGHQGQVSTVAAPGTRARAEEGEGVVVVTFLLAARIEIPNGHDPSRPEAMHALLHRIVALRPYQIAALEVIWSPAEETDRMSTAELEALYPEMRALPSDARVGKTFCGHCGGPFAQELERCPHCGAPHAA